MPRESSSVTLRPDAPAVERRPVAPAWFDAALAQAPERTHIEVEGAEIEVLSWGERGKPGLLLLHGMTAHADWWSLSRARCSRRAGVSWPSRCRAWVVRVGATSTRSSSTHARQLQSPRRPACSGRTFRRSWSDIRSAALRPASSRARSARSSGGSCSSTARWRPGITTSNTTTFPNAGTGTVSTRRSSRQSRGSVSSLRRPATILTSWISSRGFHLDLRLPRTAAMAGRGGSIPTCAPRSCTTPNAELLAPVTCRMALLFGDRSKLMTSMRLDLIRRHTPPAAPWVVIPDAGHHIMVDQPLAFIAALRSLLEAWQPAATHEPSFTSSKPSVPA